MTTRRPSDTGATRPRSLWDRFWSALFFTAFMMVPLSLALLGAWVATTLAIYNDGPVWLAAVGAVVAFFLLPLGWELWADRRQRGGRVRDAILRSSFLSAVFLVILIGTHPKDTFEALATRGDWWLGDAEGEAADTVREALFTLADRLEWLNDWVRTKAFRDLDEGGDVDPGAPQAWAASDVSKVAIPGSDLTWPLPADVHPVVASMPDSAKVSVEAVGRYIAANEPDPFIRVKAIHDFVATWVSYDYAALRSAIYPRAQQEPDVVFERRQAVCAGYAKLTAAVADAAGAEVIVLSGDARTPRDYAGLAPDALPADGAGHAWNAARINGRWYFLDTTWDTDGEREDGRPGAYATTYLFTPPSAFILDHRPDEEQWQMLPEPLSRGEWLRLPLARPTLVAYGLELLRPDRPVVTGDGRIEAELENPKRVPISLGIGREDARRATVCATSDARHVVLSCPAGPGRWDLTLWAGRGRGSTYLGGAKVEVE